MTERARRAIEMTGIISCKARTRPAYAKRHDVMTLRMWNFKFPSFCVDEKAGKKGSLSIRRLKLLPLGSVGNTDFASRSVKMQLSL